MLPILLLLPSVVAPLLLLTTSLSLQIYVLAQLVEVQVGEVGYCQSWIKTLGIMARLWRWWNRLAITLQKLPSCMDSSVAVQVALALNTAVEDPLGAQQGDHSSRECEPVVWKKSV